MGGRDFFTNVDQLFIVSKKFAELICKKYGSATSHPIDADGTTLFLIEPMSDDDTMYDSDGREYSRSGYNVLSAENLTVRDAKGNGFLNVRNTGLYAITKNFVALAEENGIAWNLVDKIDEYKPYQPHPYAIFGAGHKTALADSFGPETPFAENDSPPPHPLGEFVSEKTSSRWERDYNSEDEEGCVTRYMLGEELPTLIGVTEDNVDPVRKKFWRDYLKAPIGEFGPLPVVDEAFRDQLLERGVKASFSSFILRDEVLEESKEFFVMYPDTVVEWIDWSQSDIKPSMFGGGIDGYADLHPVDSSYDETEPLVRVAGTTLILVHHSLGDLFGRDYFYMTPLHHRFISRNLDDYLRV